MQFFVNRFVLEKLGAAVPSSCLVQLFWLCSHFPSVSGAPQLLLGALGTASVDLGEWGLHINTCCGDTSFPYCLGSPTSPLSPRFSPISFPFHLCHIFTISFPFLFPFLPHKCLLTKVTSSAHTAQSPWHRSALRDAGHS